MTPELERTEQDGSKSQHPGVVLHSVKPIGPSKAPMISATEISRAGRAKA